ncbi:MAG: zinc ribbon domain-containing protein [Microbacteriaceae bacterium]
MPTYSYRCTDCAHAFDLRQSFTDPAPSACPQCGGTLRKVFSPVGVTFSGSGFYRTDSRAKPADVPAGSASSTGSGSTGSASTASTSSGAPPTPSPSTKPSPPTK